MAESRNESQQAQAAELERLRRERAEQAAELERLKKEKAEAEAAARRAEEEFKALSETIDADVTRAERDNILQLHAQRKVRILIPSGRSPHERAPVTVGINGREFLIVRDREVDVPEGVVNVLKLAREKVAVASEVNGQQTVAWEEAPRIPFQILGYVEPPADVAEQ